VLPDPIALSQNATDVSERTTVAGAIERSCQGSEYGGGGTIGGGGGGTTPVAATEGVGGGVSIATMPGAGVGGASTAVVATAGAGAVGLGVSSARAEAASPNPRMPARAAAPLTVHAVRDGPLDTRTTSMCLTVIPLS